MVRNGTGKKQQIQIFQAHYGDEDYDNGEDWHTKAHLQYAVQYTVTISTFR